MAETIELQSTFYVMAFVMSDDSRSVVSQIGIAPVIEGKIDNADLYYEESNGTDCPSFIEEWSSLEFILKEEQVVISSKQGLQNFRSTLSKHKISMPIIPQLVDASQILPIEDIEQTASMATDARSLATLLAFKLMPKQKGEKVERVDATTNNPFFGKIFVITGKVFEHDRDDIAHFLKLLGAHQRKSISSITNFILTGDNPGYAKLRQAKEYYEAGKDITRISYAQILEIVRLCRAYVEKKVFHKEVDEQEFIDNLNRIVLQAKNDANFSDSAVNYAALAVERTYYPSHLADDYNNGVIKPNNSNNLSETSQRAMEDARRKFSKEFEEERQKRARYHRWLKTTACIVAGSVALFVIWNTGLLIPLGLIGLATSGIIKLK